MELYFSPLASSMASRIVLNEVGAMDDVVFHQVDLYTKTLVADGRDFHEINAMGQVPALRTAEGPLLIENSAILPYLADYFPEANLGASGFARYELARWISWIGAELHKQVFKLMADPHAGEGAAAFGTFSAPARLSYLNAHLTDRSFLLEHFSVADAYLFVVLGWARLFQVDLAKYPAVAEYQVNLRERPSVAQALAYEMPLFEEAYGERRRARGLEVSA